MHRNTAEIVVLTWIGAWMGCSLIAIPLLSLKVRTLSPEGLYLAILSPLLILCLRRVHLLTFMTRIKPFVLIMATMAVGLWQTPASELSRGIMRMVFLSGGVVLGMVIFRNRNAYYLYRALSLSGISIALFLVFRVIIHRDISALTNMTVDGVTILNKNGLAYHFCFLSLVLWITRRNQQLWRIHPVMAILSNAGTWVMPMCVALSGSRGAFITGLVLLAINARMFLSLSRIVALTAASLSVYGLLIMYTTDNSRSIISRLSGDDETLYTGGGRLEIWKAIPAIIEDYPRILFIGGGTGAADYYLGSYVDRRKASLDDILRKHSHSSYLEWFICYGLLGSLFGIAACVAIARSLLRYDRLAHTSQGLSLLLFFIFSSFTTVTWNHPFSVVYFAMLVDLSIQSRYRRHRSGDSFDPDTGRCRPETLPGDLSLPRRMSAFLLP